MVSFILFAVGLICGFLLASSPLEIELEYPEIDSKSAQIVVPPDEIVHVVPETARYDLPLSQVPGSKPMTVPDFISFVRDFKLCKYDGSGRPVKDGLIGTDLWISPVELWKIPSDATHVIWCSK